MKYLVIALILITGCGSPNLLRLPVWNQDIYCYGNNSNKRIFLIHGMHGDHTSFFQPGPYSKLFQDLISQGFEVVTFDNLDFDPDYYFDGGENYRLKFLNRFENVVQNSDKCFNHTSNYNVVMGISYGGLHASVVAEYSKSIQAYVLLIPVIDLSSVSVSSMPSFSIIDSSKFNPYLKPQNLFNKAGFMSWSDNDYVVDFTKSEQFFSYSQSIGSEITNEVYHGIGHTIPDQNSVLLEWLNELK